MNRQTTLTEEADARCDARVQEWLRDGLWVSSEEWIGLRESERAKSKAEYGIEAGWV